MAERAAAHQDASARRQGRSGWRPRVLPVLAGVVAVAAVGLVLGYALRGPIGARIAVSWLNTRGAPSDITFERLDPEGFVARVRIGPAADPDLTVERLEVRFAPGWRWRPGGPMPQVQSVKLVRPQLKATFDGKTLKLGSLQRLVEELQAQPPSKAPQPSIVASEALVRLATPAGPLAVRGSLTTDAGRLIALDARIGPTRLAQGPASATLTSGALILAGSPERLDGRLSLAAPLASSGAVRAQGVSVELKFATAGPAPGAQRIEGPASLSGVIRAARLEAPGQALTAPSLDLAYGGALQASAAGAALEGQGRAALTAARLDGAQASAQGLSAKLEISSLRLTLDKTAAAASAVLAGALGAERMILPAADGLQLQRAAWSGRGQLEYGKAGTNARWRGPLTTRAGWPAATARQLGSSLPLTERDKGALTRALRGAQVRAADLELRTGASSLIVRAYAPARLTAPGVELVVSPRGKAPLFDAAGGTGALSLDLHGAAAPTLTAEVDRYSLGAGGMTADGRFAAALDMPLAQHVELKGAGRMIMGRDLRFLAKGCSQARAADVGDNEPLITKAEGEICPLAGKPLLVADGRGWRIAAEGRGFSGAAPKMEIKLTDASGPMEVRGTGTGGLAGQVEVRRAIATDGSAEHRFLPILISGPLSSSGGEWTGRLQLAEAAHGRPFGVVDVRQDPVTGAGSAVIDARNQVFDPKGLQPGDVFPIARTMAAKASGQASFEGQAAWQGETLTSSGTLKLEGLSFQSPMGKVVGARAELKLTSLAPLVSAPDQSASADRVEWVSTFEHPTARFAIGADAWTLQTAEAGVSGGKLRLEPTVIPLAQNATIKSRVVLTDVDLGALVAATTLSDKVSVKGRINGDVGFTLAPDGLHIDGGRIYATGPGRLSIARSTFQGGAGAAEAAVAGPSAMQDFAYQALEDMAFDSMDATLEPRDKGRLGAVFHLKGRHDPPKAPPPLKVGVFDLLRGQAFNKPLDLPKGTPINLTLDTSLNFDELLKAYTDAMRQVNVEVR